MRSGADRAALAVCLFTALLYAPAVGVGLTADDYWWALGLDATGPGAGPFDMSFDTARAFWERRGIGFWWISDGFRWTLLRPLSVAVFELLWDMAGTSRRAWQAVNLAGYVALVTAAWPLYRRLLRGPAAVLALTLYATQFSHMQTVWFVSNLHSWLAAVPSLLGLVAWIRWRAEGWRPGLALAVAGLGLGLAASETALGALAFVVAYELGARRPRAALASGGALAVVVLYVAVHSALGYGTRESGLYLDPRESLTAYLGGLATRAPVLLAGALGVLPADLWIVSPRAGPALALAGLLGAALLIINLRLIWPGLGEAERGATRWGLLGAALTLPLVAGAPPGGRLLLWATLGTVAPIALVLVEAARVVRARAAGWKRRALLVAPIALAAGLAPLAIPLQLRARAEMAESLRSAARDAEIGDADERIVVLTMPDALTALYLLPARLVEHGGVVPAGWTVLSAATADHRVSRASPDTIEIAVLDGRMWEQPFERLFLSPRTEGRPGETFDRGVMVARILESDERGPVRVSFRFDPPPDAAGWRFLAWQDGRLREVALPEVGEEEIIAWSPSPFPMRR